jgi:hypothetical protein
MRPSSAKAWYLGNVERPLVIGDLKGTKKNAPSLKG